MYLISYKFRDKYVKKYTWAIPTWEAVKKISSYSPLVEIGAGSGYWASLIQDAGGVCVPFDVDPWKHTFCNVLEEGPEVLVNFPQYTLFLCWPPYDASMAADCLKYYCGNTVIYIGEGNGGCTGDDLFHEKLEAKYKKVDWFEVPQFYGLHDKGEIWLRR